MIPSGANGMDHIRAFGEGKCSAATIVDRAFSAMEARDEINAFTLRTEERARAEAHALDSRRAGGEVLPPLAGLVFAVKNLFDIEGHVTLAGSTINRDLPPARADAEAVAALSHAGAILVGATNMDEYAYGFTTENTHYGATRNPHDPSRTAGGSSGGSAAAVGAGVVPVALGTDTNGSIRVPASFCGIYGFKPTYGRIGMGGVYPFVESLDHAGPFAGCADDLLAVSSVLLDPTEPERQSITPERILPDANRVDGGLRIGVLDGYFDDAMDDDVRAAIAGFVSAFPRVTPVTLEYAAEMRAAAFLITAAESGARHAANLRKCYFGFDPNIRDRLAAGVIVPVAWAENAERVRKWVRQIAMGLFENFDILVAPSTPCVAPELGRDVITIGGLEVPARGSLGQYTQPLSLLGAPIVGAPLAGAVGMPAGVQIVGAPNNDEQVLAFAAHLERQGLLGAFRRDVLEAYA